VSNDSIVKGLLKILLAAEMPLGGQHGHVTKQELNLFQFTGIHMVQLGTPPAQIA
jgi:hypothetical protein